MPIVFIQEGYKFFFYSNEHRPIHVHVRHGDGEAVFLVEDGVELREAYGMKVRELARAEELVTKRREFIIQKWNEHINRQS